MDFREDLKKTHRKNIIFILTQVCVDEVGFVWRHYPALIMSAVSNKKWYC